MTVFHKIILALIALTLPVLVHIRTIGPCCVCTRRASYVGQGHGGPFIARSEVLFWSSSHPPFEEFCKGP